MNKCGWCGKECGKYKHCSRRCAATHSARTSGARCTSLSGYKGVGPHGCRWKARIAVNRKTWHIGIFDTPEEAANAYDEMALKVWGAKTYLNRQAYASE
jgi:hypothetical protein